MSDPAPRDKCPECGSVFPEIVAIGVKPDTISGITNFGVVVECPNCLMMSTVEIATEEIGNGDALPEEIAAIRRAKRDPDAKSN